jgi:mRNA-degrading endonuclease RelE of RelBE toxin-antitoxin system
MLVVETPVFTRRVLKLLTDDDYRLLQHELVARPDVGNIIRGSGGLRKVRWAATGRGKRGGVRVIYYWSVDREIILMLLIYGKNEQDDLTAEQLRALKGLVEEEFK